MRAIAVDPTVPDGGLTLLEVPDPVPGAGEVLIEVAAAGVNRADTGQRRGRYAPPPGAPPWPGLECSGVIASIGPDVSGWQLGDRVCALLSGGGYAEKVVARADHLLRVPAEVDLVVAAGFPETAATVWSNVVQLGRLGAGDRLLVHGGSSGIGTMAIQVARLLGAEVIATAGAAHKLEACRRLGATQLINYREQDFATEVLAGTDGAGVDIVLDIIGAEYLARNLQCLAPGGRLVMIGGQGGFDAAVDLREILRRRAVLTGSMLRMRSPAEKAQILDGVATALVPAWADGRITLEIDTVLPLADAMRAHERIESSAHVGKILLLPS